MYITLNGNTYPNTRRFVSANGRVIYTGQSLTNIESVSGVISLYRDDGFHLRDDNADDYLRQIINEGSIVLTNIPIPEPQPEHEYVPTDTDVLNTMLGV